MSETLLAGALAVRQVIAAAEATSARLQSAVQALEAARLDALVSAVPVHAIDAHIKDGVQALADVRLSIHAAQGIAQRLQALVDEQRSAQVQARTAAAIDAACREFDDFLKAHV